MVVDQIKVFPIKLNKHLKEGYLKDVVSFWKIQHSGFKNKKEENKDHCIELITNYLNNSSLNHKCLKGVVVEKNQTAFLVPAGPLLLTEQNKIDPGVDVQALQRRLKSNKVEQKNYLNSIDIDPTDPVLQEAFIQLRNSSDENLPHWPVIFSLKMAELHIDEEKFPVEPEKSPEIEIL